MRSNDTNDALDEISRMIGEVSEPDALDLAMTDDLDLDLDMVDASMIDSVYYFDVSALADLDDEIDSLQR
jgi:hypothetical protein